MIDYIYKTTNLINGKIYIGKHEASQFEPEKYMGSGVLITAAFKKYGKNNFICECLETADTVEELSQKEKDWIKKTKCQDLKIGYNLADGGNGILKGTLTIFKDGITRCINPEQLDNYIDDGWSLITDKTIPRPALEFFAQYQRRCKKYGISIIYKK